MSEEFYHKDIFGQVIDLDLGENELSDAVKSAKAGYGDFNSFALTDSIGERRKKDAWVLYQKALASGQAPEQLFYKVVWLVKSMLLAARTNEKDSGLNPFVYKKSKSFLKNWKEDEVEKLSENLIKGFHTARRGEGEVETMLEKILLSL
jgi:DNA polymerase III delta subunit